MSSQDQHAAKTAALPIGTIISLLQYIGPAFEFVKSVMATGISLKTLPTLITSPSLVALFRGIAGVLLPGVRDEHLLSAGASVMNPDYVRKVQNAMNQFVVPPLSPKLDPDGVYGDLTRSAVKKYQVQKKMEIVDGWAGDRTLAEIAIDTAAMTAPQVQTQATASVIPSPPAPE